MRALLPSYDDKPDLPSVFAFPEHDRAWVRAVFVSSLDGAATLEGRAGGLGSDADKRLFALQRNLADAVLVGSVTALTEEYGPAEPNAEWAHVRGPRPPTPPIAVVSGDLDLDTSAPLFTDAPADARTIVISCSAAPRAQRAALAEVADVIIVGEETVDLTAAVDALAARGLRRITCEGGPTLLAGISGVDRLDELCLTISPLLVAGDSPRITDGPPVPEGAGMRLATLLEDDDYLFMLYQKQH